MAIQKGQNMTGGRLTWDRIRRFQCPADRQQAFLWDTEMPRLAVRATKGTKSFIFGGKLARQTVRITIGSVSAWTVEDARAEARRLQTLIDQGIDPRQEKADRIAEEEAVKQEVARRGTPAMEAWAAYIEARTPRWSDDYRVSHAAFVKEGGEIITRGTKRTKDGRTLPGILRPLILLPLSEISADAVRAWLRREAATRPTHAGLAFRMLRAFINWCADHPEYRAYVHPDACAARIPRDELPKKRAKTDCLQREQLPSWFEHVRRLPNPVHSAYLQTLLLTGARREELTGVRWSDVDFQWRGLTIGDKVDDERIIPLTPYVAALLVPLPRRNEWVFSSPAAEFGRLRDPRIAHNKAIAAAGLPPLTLHGLRRSFGTLAEWVECPAGVSAQIMGHKPSATAEKHYRVRPLDLLRKWHTKIEGWILDEAGIEQPVHDQTGLRVVPKVAN